MVAHTTKVAIDLAVHQAEDRGEFRELKAGQADARSAITEVRNGIQRIEDRQKEEWRKLMNRQVELFTRKTRRSQRMKLAFLFMLSLPIFGQQTVRVTADCVIGFTFTSSGNTPVIAGNPNTGDNRQAGCVSWTLQYQSTGFSGVTLTIQDSAGTAHSGLLGHLCRND